VRYVTRACLEQNIHAIHKSLYRDSTISISGNVHHVATTSMYLACLCERDAAISSAQLALCRTNM
jgi:hypothetical protein